LHFFVAYFSRPFADGFLQSLDGLTFFTSLLKQSVVLDESSWSMLGVIIALDKNLMIVRFYEKEGRAHKKSSRQKGFVARCMLSVQNPYSREDYL
jgi:hypothetical protein